jgi:hypothetical protein
VTWDELQKRFLAKVSKTPSGCWLWQAAKYPNGYGAFHSRTMQERYAHRAAFRFFKHEIPEGCEIDHLCKNTLCVNPLHLDAVPHRENMRRSDTPMGRNARKTHCKRGHVFDTRNTYITKTGERKCRACDNAAQLRRYHAKMG